MIIDLLSQEYVKIYLIYIEHNSKLNVDLKRTHIFCDLFCGSGSIGIEALSRGAPKK